MGTSLFKHFHKKLGTKTFFCIITLISLIILGIEMIVTHGDCLKSFFFYNYSDYINFGSANMDTGMDFFNSIVCTYKGVPYTKYNTLYPPLANLFFAVLCKCVPLDQTSNWLNYDIYYTMRWTNDDLRVHQVTFLLFILFIIISALLFIFLVEMILKKNDVLDKLVAVSLLFGYGSLYAIERGNIILIVVPLILFFWFFKDSKNKIIGELALISLAIASGIKLYPAVFGLVLLIDKQYKKATRTLFYGIFAFIVPFFAFEGTEAIPIFFKILFKFSGKANYNGYGLLNIYNIIYLYFKSFNIDISFLSKPIIWCNYIICILLLAFSFTTTKRWKCCLLLTLFIILVQSSSEYTLTFLTVPFLAFLTEEKQININNWLYYFLFLFLIVPIPLTKFIVPSFYSLKCYSLQVSIIILIIVVSLDGFYSLKEVFKSNIDIS